jgi:hypothetical protein
MENNNFKDFISINTTSKSIIINRPILIFNDGDDIIELMKFYEKNYRDYKLFYCEGGEPITPRVILNLYRIHEFFLEKKLNTKKFHIFYENRSEEYEHLLGFLQFNFYYYPFHINSMTPMEFFNNGDYPYRLDPNFEKTFLCLNRTQKEHKLEFCDFIKDNGILNDSHYSMLWNNWERSFVEDDYNQSTHARHESLIHLYQNTAIQFVVETTFNTTNLSIDSTFISEKTFRALAFPRPFIVVGQKHVLHNLRKMGFRTFSDIFDESYDDMDDSVRMKSIQKVVLDLASKSKEEVYEMWEKCIEIYEHNRKSILYHCREFDLDFKLKFDKEYKEINSAYLMSIERCKTLKIW